jgi:hypothetical protein
MNSNITIFGIGVTDYDSAAVIGEFDGVRNVYSAAAIL